MKEPCRAFTLAARYCTDCVTKALECRLSRRHMQIKGLTPLGIASFVVRLVLVVVLLPQRANTKCVENADVISIRAGLVVIRHLLAKAGEHVSLRKGIIHFSRHFKVQRPVSEEDTKREEAADREPGADWCAL